MVVFDPTQGKPALPHGGTFTANPVTMRAGIAAMQALTQDSFAHLDALGGRLRDGTNAALKKHGLPGSCVGLGSLFKVHFTDNPISDYRSVYPSASTGSTRVCSTAASCRPATACSRCRRR